MSKSTSLKLYDQDQEHKFTISCDAASQKVAHADNVKFKSPLAITHNAVDDSSKSFTDMVNLVRGQDSTHSFASGLLDGRIVNTESAVATEGIAYLAHKAAIESALSSEETRSTNATDALAASLNTAVIARINGGADLTSAKLSMIGDREQAVIGYNTHVQTGITETQTLKTTGDEAITSRIDTLMSVGEVDQDTLIGVVDTYQAADTAQLADIATLQADFDALKVRIDDVLVNEAGSSSGAAAGSEYYVKITGMWYSGYSTRVKIVLDLQDGNDFYSSLQAGDVYEIQASGHNETVTVSGTSEYVAGVQFSLDFESAIAHTYSSEYVTMVKQ